MRPAAHLFFGDAVVHEDADQDQRVRAAVVLDHIDVGVEVVHLHPPAMLDAADGGI